MIGDEQHRPVARHRAVDVDADAEDAADLAMVPMRESARAAGAEAHQQRLHRHQRHGEREEGRQDSTAAQRTEAI